ncbi:hypothetical protein L1987_08442 [Smallanthus sonchifolius]|uniref:Uncharacterized protein n=1 Tax=Smallanthus sonchifolius TaxID=185202 RepID=A0ACB9JMF6_9ASTR|nr:hypothetical protein L1987_08442 [Smallanthus sonchifolius]
MFTPSRSRCALMFRFMPSSAQLLVPRLLKCAEIKNVNGYSDDIRPIEEARKNFAPGINLLSSVQLRTCPTNVYKKLRLSSQLIHQFDNESSIVTVDGALSTSWLKSKKTNTYIGFPGESGSESNCDTFYSCSCNILGAIWKEESVLKGQELENDVLDANYTKGIHLAFEATQTIRVISCTVGCFQALKEAFEIFCNLKKVPKS